MPIPKTTRYKAEGLTLAQPIIERIEVNRFLENILWEKAIADGVISRDANPLAEIRGSERASANEES